MEIKYNIGISDIKEILSDASTGELLIMSECIGQEFKKRRVTPINNLNIGTRARNALNPLGLTYVEELSDYSYFDMLKLRGMGRKSLDEIVKSANDFGVNIECCEECRGRGEVWDPYGQKHIQCSYCNK